jgi:nitrogen-specific signal transduction histidine kinase/ActR/RegA family two-component response regulator
VRTADGRPFPAVMTARAIDYEGVPCSVVSILDLTALKAAEAEIARQREALYQGEKLTALGSLLAGVAHELNNPLSIVTGYAEILRDLAPDETTRERAQEIYEAAERCARIIKTFLAMARQRPPQLGPVDLPELVTSALELAAYGLRTGGIAVAVDAEPNLPPVWGDGDQLHQVLLNLIINAQQAMQQMEGPRRLAIRVRTMASAVVTEVEDNGPGMPPEVEKRIFEPFFTTKPQGVGTGIGLSICHSIVTAHGGRIEVETAPDRGTLLCFSLPAAAESDQPPTQATDEPPALSRGRVLVVDDERGIAELVAVALRRDGLEAETAASGRAALARLEHGGIDLIISDVRMPDMDGAALVGAIRAARPELARRLILITGDVLGAQTGEAVVRAGLPILEKPLDLAALRREVRRLLEEGENPGPPEER